MENGPSSTQIDFANLDSSRKDGDQDNILEVEVLKPEEGSYGFLVAYLLTTKEHVVTEVEAESAAETSGVKVGDVILEVNGLEMAGVSAEQLRNRVQERAEGVELRLLRDGVNRLPRDCRLFKQAGFHGFGFDLHGQPGMDGHLITNVEKDSPAEKAGLLPSDLVLMVNGVSVDKKSHKQVVKLIKKSPAAMTLTVVRSSPPSNTTGQLPYVNGGGRSTGTPSEVSHPPGARRCLLIRDPVDKELGFDLYAKKGEVGHYITQVVPGSFADSAGLRAGDKILEINNVEANHDSHRELIQRITNGGKTLEFLVINENRDFSGVYPSTKGNTTSANEQQPEENVVPASQPDVNGVTSVNGNGVLGDGMPPYSEEDQRRTCHVQGDADGSMGFELLGSKTKRQVFISGVDAASPAQRAGLRPWDRLLEVNGVNIEHDPYKKVVERIKNSGSDVTLTVIQDSQPSEKSETPSVADEVRPLSTSGNPNRRSCRLVKDPGRRELGLDVTSSPFKGGHYVSSVSADSIAEASGLQAGDRIEEVNGMVVESMNHAELIQLVQSSGPDVEFLVFRDGETIMLSEEARRHAEAQSPEVRPLDPGHTRCRLVKKGRSLGLDLHTVLRDQDPVGHYVVEVDEGSPAQRAGLRPGHRLLEIDGENVETISHEDLVERIQKAPGEVDILVVMTTVDLNNLPSNQVADSAPKPAPITAPVASSEDGQRAWLASDLTDRSLGLDLVHATLHHLNWLKEVAATPALHEAKSAVLSRACRRYLQLWLPLAARHPHRAWPAPTDIEWVWHCHLLSPRAYRRDCQFLVGKLVDHAVFSASERKSALGDSRALWREEYPSEPFDMDPYDRRVAPPPTESAALTSELLAAAARLGTCYYQVSLPHYRNLKFLEEAVQRYRKFLFLRRQSAGSATLGLCPCQDAALVWRTHQLHPAIYYDVMSDVVGSDLALDFQTEATTSKADQRAAFERTRKLWQTVFGDDPNRFGALFRGEPVDSKLRPLSSEDLARAVAKTMPVTLDRLSIENAPTEVPSFTLELFTSRDEEPVQKVLNLEVSHQGQVWTRGQLPGFRIDATVANALKLRALAAPGLVAAEKSFDFTRYMQMDIREDAPVVLTYPFGSEGDFCVAINATLGTPMPGPGLFILRPGRFESGSMPPDSEELWGPAPLPELAPGVSNICTYATHVLVNHSGQTTLTARVVHSVALLQSVVQIRASGKLAVLAHLIGLEQLPLPSQVNDPKVVSFDPKRGERAMLIRNSEGDWGVCIGCWVAAKRDTSGEPASGNLSIRFFHLPSATWQTVTVDYESGSCRLSLGKVEADLRSGQVTVSSAGSSALAEHVALTLCVGLLHVLCQPRPPNWDPGDPYYSPTSIRPDGRGPAPPTREMAFPLAAGCDVATPSNQFLSIKYGRATGGSGSTFGMHDHHVGC